MTQSPQERLGDLAESLGFTETPVLEELREEIVGTNSLREVTLKYSEYHRLGIELVEQSDNTSYGAAQLGLNITLARIWRGWGDNERFIEALEDALDHATNEGLASAAEKLRDMLADAKQDRQEVQQLIKACTGIIEQEDLDELASQPLEYVLDALYPLLFAAGQDPDELLRERGFEITAPKKSQRKLVLIFALLTLIALGIGLILLRRQKKL